MGSFSFCQTTIDDLLLITPFFTEDSRGYFLKSFEKEIFEKNDVKFDVFEDFESSSIKGVLRGMHFQSKNPQAKLVRTIYGSIFDVAVDLRPESKTFGKWEGFYLDGENRSMLFIPQGFAHGFYTLSDKALVSYKCCGRYEKDYDTGIRWDDADICIKWPIDTDIEKIVLSERDKTLPTLKEYLAL